MVGSTVPQGPENGIEWFYLSTQYRYDARVMKVSMQAELLLVRMLALSSWLDTSGRLSAEQVRLCGRGMRKLLSRCDELMTVLLLSYDTLTATYWLVCYTEFARPCYPEKRPTPSKAAGRSRKSIDDSKPQPRARAQAPAREVHVPNRTPSGSVRLGTASQAPLDTNGALGADVQTRRADAEVVDSSEIDPRAFARAEIERGRKNNPAAGRKFSYRPERPDREPTGFQTALARMDELLGGSE
jgi:hypothetical protein